MAAKNDSAYHLVTALFLRLLGVIYLIAFVSIGPQIEGLVGSQGILPFSQELAYLKTLPGFEQYLMTPTLFWFDSSDWALKAATAAGIAAALLIIANLWTRTALIAAFALYLSIYHAGQLFLNFQWDGLLLEAGFLAIFLSPGSRIIILLLRWLLFRLRFMSGIAKLTMHDPTWSGLTALNYYFEVQPLPNPVSWYADHLPEWLLRFGTGATLVVEILVPLMMFLPRRWRFTAAWITILWQTLIILTSNHNWFNFLTITLCLFLFDDRALRRVLPEPLCRLLQRQHLPVRHDNAASRGGAMALAALVLFASAVHFRELITMKPASGFAGGLLDYTESWRIVNKYHVFPTMKTERIELEIAGSLDGEEWKTYRFRHKPGDPRRRPDVVIPFQPRLDWQMWFVTLDRNNLPWFHAFLARLLDGSPAVLSLLQDNPFPGQPPRYLRVSAWRYRFTDPAGLAEGRWWQREELGPFTPLPGMARDW